MDTNVKKTLILLGILIFGGWLLVSFIESANPSINYTANTLWEFRLFIIGCAILFYMLVFVSARKSRSS